MARIRSVHPSLWTDDDFVSLSAFARLMLIGIWNEADDHGLLPWKPTRLKMRIFPADDVNPRALMEELRKARFIVEIERGGEPYVAVKNFRKFQRPQRPSAPIIPIDREIARIVGLEKPNEFPPAPSALREPSVSPPRIPPQMEDGMVEGNGSSEEPSGSSGAAAPRSKSLGDLVWQIGPNFLAEHGCPERQARSLLGKWRKERGDAETLAALIAADRESVSEPVAWIEARLKNGGRQRKNGSSTSTERWDSILAGGLESIGYLCGDDGVWRSPDGETIHDPGGSGLPS